MFTGPILKWELIKSTRQVRHFLMRALYAGLLLLVMWGTYQDVVSKKDYMPTISIYSLFAHDFFVSFSGAQLGATLLLTPALMANAIVREREQKTLDYLFASDLSNSEIVFGKLFARLGHLILLIFGGVPILSLSLLFGGVDLERLIIMTIATLAVLASTSALSMMASITAPSTQQAVRGAYGMTFLLFILPFISFLLIHVFGSSPSAPYPIFSPAWTDRLQTVSGFLLASNPGTIWFQLSDTGATVTSGDLIPPTMFHVGIAAVVLALGVWRLRRVQSTMADRNRPVSARSRRLRWLSPSLDRHPMLWKEWRAGREGSRLLRWLGIALILTIAWGPYLYLWTSSKAFADGEEHIILRVCGTIGFIVGVLQILSRSASSVGVERDRDCWVSLLSTPLSSREIVWGKILGSMSPITLVLAAFAPPLLHCVWTGSVSPMGMLCFVALIVFYSFVASSIGVYFSLRSTTGKALASALFTAFMLSGPIQTMAMIPLSLVLRSGFTNGWGEVLTGLTVFSIPWIVVAGSAFDHAEWLTFMNDRDNAVGAFVFGGMSSLSLLCALGIYLAHDSARRIPSVGRLEPSAERLDPQPPDAATPSAPKT